MSRRELGLLVGLIALALVSRYVLWQRMLVVSKDSIDFVNIARSFATGDVTTMLGHYQHPLYPFLMVLCNTLVGDWILAGQVVSLAMSVLALIPFYLLVRRLFSPRDAVAATLLMMFLPRAATLSADILTESTYLAMCLAALYSGYRAAADGSTGAAALFGLFSGLAYLTRPEGGMVFLVGTAAILLAHCPDYRGRWRTKLACLALSAIIFTATAGPYLVYLRIDTGRWRLSKKKSLALFISPETLAEKVPRDNGRPTPEDVDVSDAQPDGKRPSPHAPVSHPGALNKVFSDATRAAHPLLFLLAVVGLIRGGRHRAAELYPLTVMALNVMLVFLLARYAGYASSRHLVLFGVLAIPWSLAGFPVLAKAVALVIARPSVDPEKYARATATSVRLLLCGTLLLFYFQGFTARRSDSFPQRRAGERFLQTFGPGRRFLFHEYGRAALYARGQAKDLKYSGFRTFDTVIQHAEKAGYDFLIVDRDRFGRLIKDFETTVDDYPLEPVIQEGKGDYPNAREVVIYRFPHVPASQTVVPATGSTEESP